jgi:DNA-binding MarR family transcriptional regulator
MRRAKRTHDEPTRLEAVLRLHGEFRRRLVPLKVTPLQAGVILYLHRQGASKLKEAAASVNVRSPTLSAVINDLVRMRWVTRQRVPNDDRALCLRLSPQGARLAQKIHAQVQDVESHHNSPKKAPE